MIAHELNCAIGRRMPSYHDVAWLTLHKGLDVVPNFVDQTLAGLAAHPRGVKCEDQIRDIGIQQWMIGRWWFEGKDIDPRTSDSARLQRLGQGLLIDDTA